VVRAAIPRDAKSFAATRATRLPPMRNTTGPHRARHSVFRHPATMPDKAGGKYTGTRDGRLTRRSAFARSSVRKMRPRGRVAHYMYTFPEVTSFTTVVENRASCERNDRPDGVRWSTPDAWCYALRSRKRLCRASASPATATIPDRGRHPVGCMRIGDRDNGTHMTMDRRSLSW